MKKEIKVLKKYLKQMIGNEEINISRRCNIQKHISEAIEHLEYAQRLCEENGIHFSRIKKLLSKFFKVGD